MWSWVWMRCAWAVTCSRDLNPLEVDQKPTSTAKTTASIARTLFPALGTHLCKRSSSFRGGPRANDNRQNNSLCRRNIVWRSAVAYLGTNQMELHHSVFGSLSNNLQNHSGVIPFTCSVLMVNFTPSGLCPSLLGRISVGLRRHFRCHSRVASAQIFVYFSAGLTAVVYSNSVNRRRGLGRSETNWSGTCITKTCTLLTANTSTNIYHKVRIKWPTANICWSNVLLVLHKSKVCASAKPVIYEVNGERTTHPESLSSFI